MVSLPKPSEVKRHVSRGILRSGFMLDAGNSKLGAGRIALGYGIIATLWIAFSDALVTRLRMPPIVMTIKGMAFVLVTASLLYFTIRASHAALERSGDLLTEAQVVSHVGSWYLNLVHNQLLGSSEVFRIFGIPPGTLLTCESFLAAVHPDDRLFVDEAWKEALRGAVYEVEHRIVVGKEVRWVRERAQLRFDAEGRATEGIGIVQDITERRLAEETLREKADLLNLTRDTAFVMDMAGMIRYWNRGAEEQYGWNAEEIAGVVVHDLLNTVFPAPLEEIKAEVTRTGRWEGELLHTRRDGTQIVVASRWALKRDAHEAPIAILETNRDITERKRAEDALRRVNRELRAISNCNQSLLRATDEQKLLEDICRIVCEEAGYHLAWVGYAENDEFKSVRPVAWTGSDGEYLLNLGITWAGTSGGAGPTGTAIRTGKSCCMQDFITDPRLATWREHDLLRDFRSGIALPLNDEHGSAFGSLSIYATEPNSFPQEEVRLLEELAGDLAFGIVTLRSSAARAKAEQDLRRSEAYLSEAQRLTHTGSYAGDPTTTPLFWSEEMYRIFGFDRRQGLPSFDQRLERIHPDDRDHFLEVYRRSIHENANVEVDYRILLPDGTLKHVRGTGHPVVNPEGDLVEVIGTVVDLTERRQAEELLRESETRFRTLVDQAGDALFIQDLEHGVIVDVNRAACVSLGYTQDELIGNSPDAFHLKSDELCWESIGRDGSLVKTHSHRRKDGTVFPVEVHSRVISYHGRRFLLNIARDITDRVQAEEQRARLRQLEANLAHIDRVSILGELTASVAHELKQPIAAAGLHAEVCLQWLRRDQPEVRKAGELAARILDDVRFADEIIDRLRSLYKRSLPKRELVDINQTIYQIIELMLGEAGRHAVSIVTDLARTLPQITADRVQVQQVLMNLMLNGIEAMHGPGGVLTIKSELAQDSGLEISVSDTGVGLPPGNVEQIFNAFFTTKAQGSGMGLSITRSIVESHGGRIWATSNDGPGAVFHFTLPIPPPVDASTAASSITQSSAEGCVASSR